MEVPLKFEVEIVCEREDLVTLTTERLIRITIPHSTYEGFAIVGDDEVIKLRDFQ